jgi:hypothetical protein
MRQVHQFNATVGVIVDDKIYRDVDVNFIHDYGKPMPKLPDGINERLYEPEVRHALIAYGDVKDGGPQPWPEGDALLSRIDALLDAKQRREE